GAGAIQMAWLLGLFFSGMLLPLPLFPGLLGEGGTVPTRQQRRLRFCGDADLFAGVRPCGSGR
ncbi:hypothetical protein AB0427_31805, partial [Streptomyces sp. NPDC088744]